MTRRRTWSERQRRRAVVDAHRAAVGDRCPGYLVPAHDAVWPNVLTADHVLAVAAGGREDGALQVLCNVCNGRKRDGRPIRGRQPIPAASRDWFGEGYPRSQDW